MPDNEFLQQAQNSEILSGLASNFFNSSLGFQATDGPKSIENGHQKSEESTKFQSMIRSILGVSCMKKSYVLIPVNSKYNFKMRAFLEMQSFCIEGEMMYSNGKYVQISQGYRVNLIRNINSACKNGVVFSLKDQRLKFRIKGKLKIIENSSVQTRSNQFKGIVSAIKQVLIILQKQLIVLGQSNKFSSTFLSLRAEKLKFQKKVGDFLRESFNSSEQNMASEYRKGSTIGICKQIKVNEQDQLFYEFQDQSNAIESNFFELKKQKCLIINQSSQQEQELMKKQLKKEYPQMKFRLDRQIKIISQILHPKYFLKYRVSQNDKQSLYMQYIEQNLDDHIYCYENSIGESLQLAKQIVTAAKVLEDSGIIHRDLKPDNILIKRSEKNRIIKIIDFGESALENQKFNKSSEEHNLGSTFPYSAPETLFRFEQGFNKKQIDYWSVGVLIFQVAFRKSPVSYFRSFGKDVYKMFWENPKDFTLETSFRKKDGLKIIELIIKIICWNSIKIEQNQRMSFSQMSKLLDLGQQFLSKFLI